LLSRAIENAQRRVEGHNFDMRKNLLEYDDVMNQQRRTIYSLRRQVLAAGAGMPLVEFVEEPVTRIKTRSEKTVSWADFRELVLDAMEDVIIGMTDTYAAKKNPDAWDLTALQTEMKTAFNLEMSFQPSGTVEDLQVMIYKRVEKVFLERETTHGEDWLKFCQRLYLNTIDQLWKDHLLAMDHLRQGIGLRGYGQKDPKVEYKKEGYAGFLRMLQSIKTTFVSQAMRAQPRNAQEDAERLRRVMEERANKAVESRANEDGTPAAPTPADQKPIKRDAPKVGRNDPCPCGSGKKYKKCHGASEQSV
jgi:preprotein translocase subunit SecA